MTIEEMLEVELVCINADRVVVRSLDAECAQTVLYDGCSSDGCEICGAAFDDDGNELPWYGSCQVLWVQVEDGALVIDVDGEEQG